MSGVWGVFCTQQPSAKASVQDSFFLILSTVSTLSSSFPEYRWSGLGL